MTGAAVPRMAGRDISIGLADDHNVVRQGLRALLEREPGFSIVGEAADGDEAVRLVRDLGPDVLVLDLVMPVMNGIEVTRRLRRTSPLTRVLMLSMHAGSGYVAEAFHAGVKGYVPKDAAGPELAQAVRDVSEGRRYFSPALAEYGIERSLFESAAAGIDPYMTLTGRERQILHLVGEGLTSREIAERLAIRPRTVETHRSNMMRKLGMSNQAALIRFALQRETSQTPLP